MGPDEDPENKALQRLSKQPHGTSSPALVCVIDGMERLESRETMESIALLVNMLRNHSSGHIFKGLFTTLGSSYVLGKKMDLGERAQHFK
ncbi:hypothetical protein GGR53DRAFT_469083 [Hypoxylon sp. FL1150]|nr:hypothetical protein GGR53DRAFT_469083 [Hypoxylon sp. FL1150]